MCYDVKLKFNCMKLYNRCFLIHKSEFAEVEVANYGYILDSFNMAY